MSQHLNWTPQELAIFLAKSGQKSEAAPVKVKVGGGNVACEAAEAGEARWLAKAKGGERLVVKSLEPWPRNKQNKWEKLLEQQVKFRHPAGIVESQSITLRWGSSNAYTPDTSAFDQGKYFFYECKGHRRAAGIIKLKDAAKLWPYHIFFLCTRPRGEGWIFKQINP